MLVVLLGLRLRGDLSHRLVLHYPNHLLLLLLVIHHHLLLAILQIRLSD